MKGRIIFSIIIFLISGIKAQNRIDQAIQTLDQKYAQEKVYLLFDKEKYISGENMWFKSFVFDGYNRSAISSSLFVELYDSGKNIISKKVFPVVNGEANGSLSLSDKLKEDVYFVRAYTTWMANFSEEFQLVQPIPVYNPSSPQKLVVNTHTKWTAKAYPEGGTFIENIPTKVAVRLQSDGAPPSAWNGYVIDTANPAEKITSFKGLDQNVGLFKITPKPGKSYQVVVEDNNGTKQNIDLQLATGSGINLQVLNNAKEIQYTLKSYNLSGLKGYKVVGTVNNLLAYKANISANTKEVSSIIPSTISNQMNGILQLTVFDEHDRLIAQRLCFIEPDNLHVNQPVISGSKFNNTARAYNTIEFPSQENYSNYTVVVRDEVNKPEQNNILSALWLTGDFSSKISAPAQYFAKNANPEALDALLISEKWKRFDWNAVIAGKIPKIKYKPEPFLSYKGKVIVNSGPVPNTEVNLIFKPADGNSIFHQVQTDANGYFMLNDIYIDEPLKVEYFLNTQKKGASNPPNLKVTFNSLVDFVPYKGSLPSTEYVFQDRKPGTELSPEIARAMTNKKNQKLMYDNAILIKEVQLKAQKRDEKKILNDKLSSAMFRGANEQIFDFINENQDAQSYINILQWLQGRVAGLTFYVNEKGEYVPVMRGYSSLSGSSQGNVPIFLDEALIDISNIPPTSQIAMVKVIKGFTGGIYGRNAIAIYSRRGGIQPAIPIPKDPHMDNSTVIEGYDNMTPFYEPDYSKDAYKSITNDTREVIYWNPDLRSVNKMPLVVNFYNNDTPNNYQITIIAFDKDDKPLFYNNTIQ
ncbi:hypothetical protein [Elizabethkingia meningoseptica]|uniref:hypothetical protein n=1 Tax=Elizabethkingia meningoseptica TaxID=238 RepID=UPI0038924FF7